MPNGIVEWGRRVALVKETEDAVQVVFEDGAIETCDLIMLFGPGSYQPQYEYANSLSHCAYLTLAPTLQSGHNADQVVITFSCSGFFSYALTLPLTMPVDEQQVMFWSTFATDTPPAHTDNMQVLLIQKHGLWNSAYIWHIHVVPGGCWLMLPRYEIPHLPHWMSLHGTTLAPPVST
ncbi:hypothetical protein EDD18DRAFT_1344677 [Armillaria luteobubalina]|uniref:Uncharacterized protein n=1 Tax=Armillaria luteobubalina TaxID=153913 RepID=A0AA39QIW5_9AGAR|nr:hypothetical protein EDD18DRAFT_1344677 [Armillaria luteobubalina]